MKRILIILTLIIGVAQAQSKAGFYVVGGKIITVQDTSSRNYLKAIENAGVVPTVTQNAASNFLVTSEKAIGSYVLMSAQYPFIGGTAATHKFNLNNPIDTDAGFRLAYSGTITHSANGMQGDGSTGYANTFVNPSTSLTTGNSHLSFYSNTNSANSSVVSEMGVVDGSGVGNDFRLIIRRAGDLAFVTSSNSTSADINQYTNTNSIGYFIGNTLSNSISLRNNGILQTSTNQYSSGSSLANFVVYLLAINQFGTIPQPTQFSTKRSGYASIGAGFTDTQALQQSRIVTFFNSMQGR